MKKIIIIDDENRYTHAYVRLGTKDEEGFLESILKRKFRLQDMPFKRESLVRWRTKDGRIAYTHETTEYDKGWNDCIDFILGDGEYDGETELL